jgi:hypothetical protein
MAGLCDDVLFKAHLRADMEHDAHGIIANANVARLFGRIPTFVGTNMPDGIQADDSQLQSLNTPGQNGFENNIFTYFLRASGKTAIDFIIRNNTAMYPKTSDPFKPFREPNEELGIVFDAGKPLFRFVQGSWNVGNVGTIIDPASKLTRKEEDRYVWKPFTEQVDVSGCVFGFDSNVVGNISFRSFRGTLVQCGITYNGQLYDVGTGRRTEARLTDININDRTGFLVGNNANTAVQPNDPVYPLYFAGKALGDALQVYVISRYAGGLNPDVRFIAPGSWRRPDTIANTMISTNDKLNHARAVRLGVSTTYLYRAQGEPVTSCNFVPGELIRDPKSEKELYQMRFDDLKDRVRRRYNTLIRSLQSAYNERTARTFGFEGNSFFQDETKHRELRRYFFALRTSVVYVKISVLWYFNTRCDEYLRPENRRQLARNYSYLNSVVEKLSPPGSLTRQNGDFLRLKRIVMVCDGRTVNDLGLFRTYMLPDRRNITIENGFQKAHYIHLQTDLEDIKAGREISRSPVWYLIIKPTGGKKSRKTRRSKMYGGDVHTSDPYPDPQIPTLVLDITNLPAAANIRAYAVNLYNMFVCILNIQNASEGDPEVTSLLEQERAAYRENIQNFNLPDIPITSQKAYDINELIFPNGDRASVFSQFVDFLHIDFNQNLSLPVLSIYVVHLVDELVKQQQSLYDLVVLKDLIREAEEIVLLFPQPPQPPATPPRTPPSGLFSQPGSEPRPAFNSPDPTLNASFYSPGDSGSESLSQIPSDIKPPSGNTSDSSGGPVVGPPQLKRSRSEGGRRTRRKTPKVVLF